MAKRRGWQEATIWTQTFGPFGELAIEVDYPDLATCERQTAAYFADEECMKLLVDGMKYVRPDGAGYNEMWQRAEPVTAGA